MKLLFFLLLAIICLVPHVQAFWRLPCGAPISVQRADPIVQPGVVSGHVHTIMGGSGFSATSTPASIRQSKCSTCKVVEDKSNYWIGQLYYQYENGSYVSVPQIGGMLVYYLQREDSHDINYGSLRAFPDNLVMVAGTPTRRRFDVSDADMQGTTNNTALEERAVSYACINYAHGSPETHVFPTTNCPQGLRTQVFFPSCWDGNNTDSHDHKSHMHYPDRVDNGYCPPTHPIRLISIFYEVTFDINKFASGWIGADGKPFRPFPFVWSTSDQTGNSHHADFMNGWNSTVLQQAVTNCTNLSGVIEDCPYFTYSPAFGGDQCKPENAPLSDEQVLGFFPAGTPLPGQHVTTPLTWYNYNATIGQPVPTSYPINYDGGYGNPTPSPTGSSSSTGTKGSITNDMHIIQPMYALIGAIMCVIKMTM